MNNFSGNKDCTLCHGEGSYMYDDNHGKICENCCTHPEGFTQLDPEMFGVKEGELVCKTGCGARKMTNTLSPCQSCNCMTKTIDEKCGKCKAMKEDTGYEGQFIAQIKMPTEQPKSEFVTWRYPKKVTKT